MRMIRMIIFEEITTIQRQLLRQNKDPKYDLKEKKNPQRYAHTQIASNVPSNHNQWKDLLIGESIQYAWKGTYDFASKTWNNTLQYN